MSAEFFNRLPNKNPADFGSDALLPPPASKSRVQPGRSQNAYAGIHTEYSPATFVTSENCETRGHDRPLHAGPYLAFDDLDAECWALQSDAPTRAAYIL